MEGEKFEKPIDEEGVINELKKKKGFFISSAGQEIGSSLQDC